MNDRKSAGPGETPAHRLPSDAPARRGDKMSEKLKTIYDQMAAEPVPDDFLRLLDAADEKKTAEPGNEP